MTSKLTITRERLEKIKSWRETYGAGSNVMLPAEEAEELARIALSAIDSEPVAWRWRSGPNAWWQLASRGDIDGEVEPLYRHAQPAPVVPKDVMPGGLVYSSALPKFESNDSDKVVGYCCFISGETRIVEIQEQAYADTKAVLNACRAAMQEVK